MWLSPLNIMVPDIWCYATEILSTSLWHNFYMVHHIIKFSLFHLVLDYVYHNEEYQEISVARWSIDACLH